MTTTLDIINRAFRKVGIKAEDEALTADQAAHGLSVLNDMMFGWPIEGIARDHTALTLSETFPIADKYNQAVVYMLARTLSPDYEVSGIDDDRYRRLLQAAFLTIDSVTMPTELTNTSSQRRLWVQE